MPDAQRARSGRQRHMVNAKSCRLPLSLPPSQSPILKGIHFNYPTLTIPSRFRYLQREGGVEAFEHGFLDRARTERVADAGDGNTVDSFDPVAPAIGLRRVTENYGIDPFADHHLAAGHVLEIGTAVYRATKTGVGRHFHAEPVQDSDPVIAHDSLDRLRRPRCRPTSGARSDLRARVSPPRPGSTSLRTNRIFGAG